jgi:hypothetical protein
MILKLIFWFQKEGGGMSNTIKDLEVTKRSFRKVSPEEYIGDIILDTLLANASRNGEI